MATHVESVFDLSPAEKLQLVQDLWDDLVDNHPDAIPVRESHLVEAERRMARLAANPGTGLTWEEVKRRVRARHGR